MIIKKGLVYAIIPARSGSTTVKDKNIRLLGEHPMIAYSIAAAKLSEGIDRVFVSTDSERYRNIALRYEAEVPFLRPSEISGPWSTDLEFMKHIILWLEENEGILPEYWVHLRPTTPFRDPKTIQDAIKKFKESTKATSLRSAHRVDACPQKWFKINQDGYYETLCGITTDEANNPRQSFPPVYMPDGYVDILKTEYILENGRLHGDYVLAYEVPDTIDVDYECDFKQLQESISGFMGSVPDWLATRVNL